MTDPRLSLEGRTRMARTGTPVSVGPRLGEGAQGSGARGGRRTEQPRFRAMITIGRHLVEAFEALHATGLCYRDVSFGNMWVDPERGDVAIIDNDNVGVDGGGVFVWGTLRFMAPEVVRRDAFPSSVTDLYSLAVFLFYLFVHGHPLEGVRTEATVSWGSAPRESERVSEGVWRRALLRLGDAVAVCSCRASVFYDPSEPSVVCWNCGNVPPRPPVLQLPGGSVVLSDGATITAHHLRRNRDHETVVAVVEAHPASAGQVVLRNASAWAWTMRPDGESAKRVEPGRRLAVRTMTIDFGSVRGRVPGRLARGGPAQASAARPGRRKG
jgi:hypothetical protein